MNLEQETGTGMVPVFISSHQSGLGRHKEDLLAVERALEIRLGCENSSPTDEVTFTLTMRTPGDDEALTAGLLLSEGIVEEAGQIRRIFPCKDNPDIMRAWVDDSVLPRWERVQRRFVSTSSCGLCGKNGLSAVETGNCWSTPPMEWKVDSTLLDSLPAILRQHQPGHDSTGCMHACGLFNLEGELQSLKEDVGRHNALDKLLGRALLSGELPLSDHLLVLSGRAGFEMIQKASLAGIGLVVACGAPTSLAVELAQKSGITLAGFAGRNSLNVYSVPERIKGILS